MKFEYIWIDQTDYLTDCAKQQIGRYYELFIFTPEEQTYCCELTPSHWLEAVGFETTNEISEELWCELNSYLWDSCHYMHCSNVSRFNPKHLGEFEDLEEAREYAQGNPPCYFKETCDAVA